MNDAKLSPAHELKVGGPVDSAEQPYVSREADQELLDLLTAGEFVNVVTSRQMGKTSLVYRAMAQLAPQGYQFAYYDLSALRSETDARRYFQTLVGELARELDPGMDLDAFWMRRGNQTVSQGFIDFLRVVLTNSEARVIVVLDEIDSTLERDFTDDLFTAIRSIYTARPREAAFKRITFCLVGVATPNELIKTRRTTPYNIGRTIWLRDFDASRDDLAPIASTLSADPLIANRLLARVLYWTGGQPYLTAWMCDELRRGGARNLQAVDALVEGSLSSLDTLRNDPHFEQTQRFMSERVVNGADVLRLYERVLRGEQEADQAANLTYAHLKLSGLVKRDAAGNLVTRNRIYKRLFDLEWLNKSKPKQELRVARRFGYAAVAALSAAMIGGAVYFYSSVVPLQQQADARQALEKLQVTLKSDFRGWINVDMPAEGRNEILKKSLPYLVSLSNGPNAQALSLNLSGSDNLDFGIVAGLTGLRRLDLSNTKITDLGPLRRLTGLQQLNLMNTHVKDLTPLSSLVGLEELDLSATRVADLTPIAQMSKLKRLTVAMSAVTNLAPLTALKELEVLDASFTRVYELGSLDTLERLQQLDMSDTELTDAAVIGKLIRLFRLRELNLARTKISESALSAVHLLTSLRTLSLDGTGITNFNTDGRITELRVLQDPATATRNLSNRIGDTFRDCRQCPQMVIVPSGSFIMGAQAGEKGNSDEQPQHKVTIRNSFAVGKYEVRFDEWMHCVADGVCGIVPDEGWGRGPRPVVNISWYDAKAYTDWLSRRTGKAYRLLTEAEWEYAARARTTTARFWGSAENAACRYANVADQTARGAYRDRATHDCNDSHLNAAPVGTFEPNAFGLYDMLGNAWEWVEDCHQSSYQSAPADGSAWVPKNCASRVIRGGSWLSSPSFVRSSVRFKDYPAARDLVSGFRVARMLNP